MKYRVFTLLGLMALSAATLVEAQDYDDIYYDASSSKSTEAKATKVVKPAKTIAVYGEVPEKYKVVTKENYRVERDVDEYNRRGAYEPGYEVTIDGDTIYEEDFANTRRIERFYNPDIVILSDDDELVELYYDESPTINLLIGSDWGYNSYYGFGSSYYPWYSWGSYYPWGTYGWYDPWYGHNYYGWYRPIHYGYYWGWGWGYRPWYYSHWWPGFYGWDNWHYKPFHYADWGHRPRPDRPGHIGGGSNHRHVDLSPNRNTRNRVGLSGSRNGISRGEGNRPSRVGKSSGSRNRGGYTSSGNMGSRNSSGVTSRSSSVSRSRSGNYSSGSRPSGGSRVSGSSRSSGSYSSGSRSSGGYSSGSSHSSGSYSGGGGSRSSGGGGGGGSHGGSSGGGGHRR